MRRRLLGSTALIALAAVVVLGVPLGIVEANRQRSEARARLEREADAVAAAIDDRIEARRPLDPHALARLVRPGHQVLITLPSGRRVTVGSPVRGTLFAEASGASEHAHVVGRAPASEISEGVRHTWLLVGLLGAGAVAAATALGALQARRLARPLERLAATSEQLGTGDFSARAGRFAIPEMDAVAAALDATAVRIAHLLGREREFSANVSHQLRTPLTALRLRLEELAQLEDPALLAAETEGALQQADRLERTISDLLSAARSGRAGEVRALRLDELAARHLATWRPVYERDRRELVLDAPGPVMGMASPGAVGQALDVLLDNALRHGAGPVRVTVDEQDGGPRIAVADAGPGVPEGAEREIFERGSSLGGGTGVGLHLARTLVEVDGGQLVLAEPRPARFEIRLPIVPGIGPPVPPIAADPAVAGRGGPLPNL